MDRQYYIREFLPGTMWRMVCDEEMVLWYQPHPCSMDRDIGPPHIINDMMFVLPENSLVMVIKTHEKGLWCIALFEEKLIKIFLPGNADYFKPVQANAIKKTS
jgi:hypothetical protein